METKTKKKRLQASSKRLWNKLALERLQASSKRLWTELALKRANYKCERCGKTTSLNVHHIIGKGRCRVLRWDLENALVLCSSCHTFGRVSAHSTNYFGHKEFDKWLEKYLDKERADYLQSKEKTSLRVTLQFLEEENEKLKTLK